MKALIVIFTFLLVLLLAGLWVGSGSYPEHWKLKDKILAQEVSNEERKQDIKRLQADLDDVNSGHGAVEERARSEHGMTAKGETFFKVILNPKKAETAPKTDDKTLKADSDKKSSVNE